MTLQLVYLQFSIVRGYVIQSWSLYFYVLLFNLLIIIAWEIVWFIICVRGASHIEIIVAVEMFSTFIPSIKYLIKIIYHFSGHRLDPDSRFCTVIRLA